jgi:hypothetical protein
MRASSGIVGERGRCPLVGTATRSPVLTAAPPLATSAMASTIFV